MGPDDFVSLHTSDGTVEFNRSSLCCSVLIIIMYFNDIKTPTIVISKSLLKLKLQLISGRMTFTIKYFPGSISTRIHISDANPQFPVHIRMLANQRMFGYRLGMMSLHRTEALKSKGKIVLICSTNGDKIYEKFRRNSPKTTLI